MPPAPLSGPVWPMFGDRLLPDVEYASGGEPGWHLHHQRPLLGQIPEAEGVEGGDIGGEHPRLVLQAAVKQHVAVAHAHGFGLGVVERLEAHRRQGPQVALGGALQVEGVVQLAGGGGARVAVLQLQPAQRRGIHGCDAARLGQASCRPQGHQAQGTTHAAAVNRRGECRHAPGPCLQPSNYEHRWLGCQVLAQRRHGSRQNLPGCRPAIAAQQGGVQDHRERAQRHGRPGDHRVEPAQGCDRHAQAVLLGHIRPRADGDAGGGRGHHHAASGILAMAPASTRAACIVILVSHSTSVTRPINGG